MSVLNDPFEVLVIEEESDEFATLTQKPVTPVPSLVGMPGAVTARLHGFDPEDHPLVVGAPGLPDEMLLARSTVPLRRSDTGSTVVVLFDGGDVRRPIVVGVIQDRHRPHRDSQQSSQSGTVRSDDERIVVSDEPEIALRCGEASAAPPGVVTGVLIGFQDQGRTPLVMFPGQTGTAAVAARTTQDLHAAHIGRQVVLLFESADARLPIIVGSINQADGSLPDHVGHAEVEADGERLIVSAKEQLVLRCGKASVTLTKAGKVLIQGTYVSTYSSGANRIKGGSVQIN